MIINFNRSFLNAAVTTWPELVGYLLYTSTICVMYLEWQFSFLPINTTPITVLGTVVSLLLTFRNNSAYDRWWEARKIWGGITNQSRSFGAQLLTLITPVSRDVPLTQSELKGLRQELIYRHLAYINMLRLQLRNQTSVDEVKQYLSDKDWQQITAASNKATQLNLMQAQTLAKLKIDGLLSDFAHITLLESVKSFYDQQGASERIKNTPFPRIYDFGTRFVFWVFLSLLPIALLEDFGYKTIFFSWIVAFVFIEVIRLGIIMQDPFRNQANDTPMSAICRTIEIDLKQMLGETSLPLPLKAEEGVLM
jgi:ion channel-forming bestrophin family protein